MMVLFLVALGSMAWIHATSTRAETMDDTFGDIDVLASLLSSELRNSSTTATASERLAEIVPDHALKDRRTILLTDENGSITASLPAGTALRTTLVDVLGTVQPLTTFGDRAGVMLITIPGNVQAIATVRNLPSPYGQVAVVQPVAGALVNWRTKTTSFVLLLGAAGVVLSGISAAYFWQAWRARHADTICEKVRKRLDTALSRGRCGLWDWDIARGQIYWSDSMYEMLGYTRQNEFLSFGEVNRLVHPEDGDLYALADMLASCEATNVDHAFRVRSAQGDWIWLRARAELVRDGDTRDPHLIGITIDITEQRRLAAETATADMRLRDAIETISEAFVLWDSENRLVMCNSKFQVLHNLTPDRVSAGNAIRVHSRKR